MKKEDSENLAEIVASGAGRPRFRFVVVVILLLLIAGGGWFAYRRHQEKQNAGPTYVTEPLKRGSLSIEVTATGNLAPTNKVSVGSELSGIVLEVLVDRNDQVKKGQPLAKLDTTKLMQTNASARANLQASKARVTQANATLKEAEANLGRAEELLKLSGGKTPSKAEMDSTRASHDRALADLASAEAAVEASQAAIRSNETDLSKAIIKSPIDGIVLTRTVEPGQTVAASFTAPELFVIAESLERMELQVAVAEADIGRVEKGQQASFSVDAWPDREFKASVTLVAFGSEITNNVVTYDTELEVPNDDLSLRPGMTATADIAVASAHDVLLAPNAALRFKPVEDQKTPEVAEKKSFVQSLMPRRSRRSRGRGDDQRGSRRSPEMREQAKVWVLREGSPTEVRVEAGLTDGTVTEISTPDLAEGDEVIIRREAPKP